MLVQASRRLGIKLRGDLSSLPPRFGRIPWDDFARGLEDLDEACDGDDERYRALAKAVAEAATEFQAMAALVVEPEGMFRLVLPLSAWAMPCVRYRAHYRPRRITVELELVPEARDCLACFRISKYSLAYTTTFLGLPPCEVEAKVEPRRGTYELFLPPSRTLAARGRRTAQRLHSHGLQLLEIMQDEFRSLSSNELAGRRVAAPPRWHLTPREDQVLEHLVEGLSNKQIASMLGCASRTVDVHVTHLLRKSGASGRAQLIASFWRTARQGPREPQD